MTETINRIHPTNPVDQEIVEIETGGIRVDPGARALSPTELDEKVRVRKVTTRQRIAEQVYPKVAAGKATRSGSRTTLPPQQRG